MEKYKNRSGWGGVSERLRRRIYTAGNGGSAAGADMIIPSYADPKALTALLRL